MPLGMLASDWSTNYVSSSGHAFQLRIGLWQVLPFQEESVVGVSKRCHLYTVPYWRAPHSDVIYFRNKGEIDVTKINQLKD